MVPSNTVAAEVDEEATTEEAGAARRSKARTSDWPIGHGDEEAAGPVRRGGSGERHRVTTRGCGGWPGAVQRAGRRGGRGGAREGTEQ